MRKSSLAKRLIIMGTIGIGCCGLIEIRVQALRGRIDFLRHKHDIASLTAHRVEFDDRFALLLQNDERILRTLEANPQWIDENVKSQGVLAKYGALSLCAVCETNLILQTSADRLQSKEVSGEKLVGKADELKARALDELRKTVWSLAETLAREKQRLALTNTVKNMLFIAFLAMNSIGLLLTGNSKKGEH